MFLVVFVAVLLRLVNISFVSSYDFARLFFIWITFLGMTVVYKKREHIKFNFLYDRFTNASKVVIDLIIDSMILIIFIVILYVSIQLLPKIAAQSLPGSGIPAIWLYLPFVVSSTIMIMHALAYILNGCLSIKTFSQKK
jgi:TRAP-type C4-dicarboxylate transport system permease small subunit